MKGALVATYHFRTCSGRRPRVRDRQVGLAGQLDQLGEEVIVGVDEPLREGTWYSGTIQASTSLHFKIGNTVSLLVEASNVTIEHD